MIDKALQPLYWLMDAMMVSGLLTAFWFFADAAYQEWRYGADFRSFRRENARYIPFVFGILCAVVCCGIWWFQAA